MAKAGEYDVANIQSEYIMGIPYNPPLSRQGKNDMNIEGVSKRKNKVWRPVEVTLCSSDAPGSTFVRFVRRPGFVKGEVRNHFLSEYCFLSFLRRVVCGCRSQPAASGEPVQHRIRVKLTPLQLIVPPDVSLRDDRVLRNVAGSPPHDHPGEAIGVLVLGRRWRRCVGHVGA